MKIGIFLRLIFIFVRNNAEELKRLHGCVLFGFSLAPALSATDDVRIKPCFYAKDLHMIGSALTDYDIFKKISLCLLHELLKQALGVASKSLTLPDIFYLGTDERKQKLFDGIHSILTRVYVDRREQRLKSIGKNALTASAAASSLSVLISSKENSSDAPAAFAVISLPS